MTENSFLIRINLIDSYAASTTIKINSTTLAEEVCLILSLKLNINDNDKIFDSLICVINGYDGKNTLHWLKTLKKSDNILEFQSNMLKKRIMKTKNQDLINSFNITWYYKDIRSIPLNLDGDTSGNSSDEDESEISLNDLIYFGNGDRRAMLLKRSHSDPNLWRKRLCILNDKLWCINLKKKAPYASCLQLNGKVMLQDEVPDLHYPNGIIIQNPNQNTYFFRAGSVSEQHIWKDELLDRAAFGIENSVLYMGEMIICDEEFARCSKKNKVTRNSIQRQLVWKCLKNIEQYGSIEFIKINNNSQSSNSHHQFKEINEDDDDDDDDNNDEEEIDIEGIKIVEGEYENNSTPPSFSPNAISMDMLMMTDENLSEIILNHKNSNNNNHNHNKLEAEKGELNADQVFKNRSVTDRVEACSQYRLSTTNSFNDLRSYGDQKKLIGNSSSMNDLFSSSSTLAAASHTSSLAPRPSYASRRRNRTESHSIASSIIDISPIPLSSLPNSPVQLLHSFHCYSPHLTASISLLDSIHDYKSAFRHDLHMNPVELWILALKIYYDPLLRFIQLISSHQKNSPWNVIKDFHALHIQSPSTSTTTTESSIVENEQQQQQQQQLKITNELNDNEKEIYCIIERIKNIFVSNFQNEIKLEKKSPVKKKVENSGSYWFWPSTEPEDITQNQNQKEDVKKNQTKITSLSVGYGYQLIDSSIKPPITLFDELIPEHILTNQDYEYHNIM